MAKTKEAGLPVIIALVFFVLISVGLGVFCYVLFSDQAAKDADVADAQKKAKVDRATAVKAENKVRMYRVALGIDEGDEKATLLAETKAGDETVAELKKVNDDIRKRLQTVSTATADKDKVKFQPVTLKDLLVWAPDADNKLSAAPTKVILDGAVKAYADREVVRTEADQKAADYESARDGLAKKSKAYDDAAAKLTKVTNDVSATLDAALKDLKKTADDRLKNLDNSTKDLLTKNDKAEENIIKLTAKSKQLSETLKSLRQDLSIKEEQKKKSDQFTYDEPVCKVLRRNSDDTLEIDLGSLDKAKPGLTFSVLPADFPSKGYQSRVKVFREADERGQFHDVPRFMEKGTLEILEILGPSLAKARLTSENDRIRDRVLPGDLLYSAVWRRGYVEHVAFFGIYDTNGDGTDDIKNVVRDFTRMGIPVDAYYDLATKKWVGELTPQTRYAVEGFTPNGAAPTADMVAAKGALISAISTARQDADLKGAKVVSFRDFFPRMGYKVRPDVTEDKINQAAYRYMQLVGSADAPPPAPEKEKN